MNYAKLLSDIVAVICWVLFLFLLYYTAHNPAPNNSITAPTSHLYLK